MQLYSAYGLSRARQIASDLFAVAVVAGSWMLGSAAAGAINTLAAFGRGIEDAGAGFQGTMSDAAARLAGIPFIGERASAPFGEASDAGAFLVNAGREQQALVAQTAFLAGLIVALVPLAFLVRYWLLRRVAFVRRAAAMRLLAEAPGGVELLALRALACQKPTSVLAADPDPVAAWRAGEPAVLRRLANLALREAGVRLP
jgi:hypothetical protein